MSDETLPPFKKHPRIQKVREWMEAHPTITKDFAIFLVGFICGAVIF